MNDADKHLTDEQIEAVEAADSGRVDTEANAPSVMDFRGHLASCELCRTRLAAFRNSIRSLGSLSMQSGGVRTAECPPEVSLLDAAAGVGTGEQARAILDHVLHCDYCGQRFKLASQLFSDVLEPEEQSMISSLRSGTTEWQRDLGHRLTRLHASTDRATPRVAESWIRPWKRRWVLASAGVVAVSAATLVVFLFNRQPPIERLLGEAYAESRVLEIQIPGARHTISKGERGGRKSGVERPALALAEVRIAKELVAKPGDAKWLQAKGRAELLEGNVDAAMESLERARDADPELRFLFTDLGAAYFQRAEKQHEKADYGQAIEYFSKALSKNSRDEAALFDRAIALERANLFAPAVQDWKQYLKSFPGSEWSGEAQEKLQNLRERLRSSSKRHHNPVLSPTELSRRRTRELAEIEALISTHLESYLDAATADWLVRAGAKSDRSRDLDDALQLVSHVAADRHQDTWLQELVKESASPLVYKGVRVLSDSIQSNAKGDFEKGVRNARVAQDLFRRGRSSAGELRGRLEEAYSLKLSNQGLACLDVSRELEKLPDFRRYKWIAIRSGIEKGDCLSLTGDLGGALAILITSRKAAERAGFQTSYLRATAFIADIEVEVGDLSAGWKAIADGLALFDEGSYPAMRAYNLYASMDELADASHLWNLQRLVWHQAITTIEAEDNPLLKAMAYSRLGASTLMAGQAEESAAAFERAKELLAASPKTEATRNREIDAVVWLARAQARQVGPEQAEDLLRSLESEIGKLSSEYVVLDYYGALGEIEWRRMRYAEARQALDKCIQVSEKALRSLESEEDRIRWSRSASGCYRLSVELKLRQGEVAPALALWEWYLAAPLRRAGTFREIRSTGTSSSPEHDDGQSILRLQGMARQGSKPTMQTRISYAVFEDGLGIWVYDDREIRGRWISLDPDELVRRVNAFTDLCAHPTSNRELLRARAAALYGLLWAGIADWLPQSRERVLVIEPDEALSAAPLEVLIDREGRYLAESRTLAWSPGLYYSNLGKISKQPVNRDDALVVAAPAVAQFDEEILDPIPDALREGQSVARRFPGSTLIVGERATVEKVSEGLKTATLFHYAGHAVTENRHPGLLLVSNLADGRTGTLLTAKMVQRLPMTRMQIAVLAACSTQNGSQGGAFDPDSLARAFLRAGARQVVSSRWNVDSYATSRLLDNFYVELAAGNSVFESLRRAQEAIRANRETSHPFFWAGFAAIGNP